MTRALVAACAATAWACSSGSTTGTSIGRSASPRTIAAHAPAWDVTVDAPGGDDRFSFTQIDSAAATRAARPIVVAGATIATDQPHATARFDGPGQDRGEVIGVVEHADATSVSTLGGDQYAIPRAPDAIDQRWYDLAPGVLGVVRTTAAVVIARHDRGAAQPTWQVTVPAADEARIVGWLDGGDPILMVNRGRRGSLTAVHLADGALRPIATIPAGRVAVARRAGRFAVVSTVEMPDGTEPVRVEIRELAGGAVERTFDLSDDYPFGDDLAMGFDGRALWIYWYRPEHHNDVLGTKIHEGCGYSVYDVEAGRRVRTLADATGGWARIATSCRVHALLPTLDGGAIAFAVGGDRQAEVVGFDGPP